MTDALTSPTSNNISAGTELSAALVQEIATPLSKLTYFSNDDFPSDYYTENNEIISISLLRSKIIKDITNLNNVVTEATGAN